VRRRPLRERKPLLAWLLSFDGPLRFAEHRDGNGEPYWEDACAQGWEGLVAKRAAAAGFNAATLAQLTEAMERLGRPRSPFDAGDLPRSRVHWVEPAMVAQIGFSEWTTAGQLRHPRYLGLRPDKDPRTVVREIPS